MNLIVVCISRNPESFDLPFPFYCLSEDLPNYPIKEITKAYQSALKTRDWKSSLDYISYLAEKRNLAIKLALEKYPDTTDIISCDSYYVHQNEPLNKLISDYKSLKSPTILGGAVWGKQRTRISHLIRIKKDWYDKWGVPELRWVPYKWNPMDDWLTFRMRVPIQGLYRTKNI